MSFGGGVLDQQDMAGRGTFFWGTISWSQGLWGLGDSFFAVPLKLLLLLFAFSVSCGHKQLNSLEAGIFCAGSPIYPFNMFYELVCIGRRL